MNDNRNPVKPEAFAQEDFIDRLMGIEDLAKEILEVFVEDMPRQLAMLSLAVKNTDAKALRLTAHSVSGASGNVGGAEMQELARKLERMAVSGDLSTAAAAVPELSAAFDRARVAMECFLKS